MYKVVRCDQRSTVDWPHDFNIIVVSVLIERHYLNVVNSFTLLGTLTGQKSKNSERGFLAISSGSYVVRLPT